MAPFVVVFLAALALPRLSEFVDRRFAGARFSRIGATAATVERAPRANVFDVYLLVVLIGFSALRAITVGTDNLAYARAFAMVDPRQDWWATVDVMPHEAGYTLLALAVKATGAGYDGLLWVAATVTVGASYWAIRRTSNDVPLSVALYVLLAFYLTPMNLIRQGMASALIFLAATFVLQKVTPRRIFAFGAMSAVAASLHTTALAAAVVIILVRAVQMTRRRALMLLAVGAALAASIWASEWLTAFIRGFNPRYGYYFETEAAGGIGTYLILAFTVALTLYALSLNPSPGDRRWATLVVIGALALIMGTQSFYAVRLADYFTVALVVLLPNAMKSANVPTFHRFALLTLATAYFVVYLANFAGLTPYEARPL